MHCPDVDIVAARRRRGPSIFSTVRRGGEICEGVRRIEKVWLAGVTIYLNGIELAVLWRSSVSHCFDLSIKIMDAALDGLIRGEQLDGVM